MDADNIKFQEALEATSQMMVLRELSEQVCVGPMPEGAINILNLPIREPLALIDFPLVSKNNIVEYIIRLFRFRATNQFTPMRHVIGIVDNIPSREICADQLKGIFRKRAWGDLPNAFQFRGHPYFQYKSQYFLLMQQNGNYTLVKHYLTADKLTQAKIGPLAMGTCYEVAWGTGNKVVERKALQWMLEQMGGLQFRHFSLSSEKKRPASSSAMGATMTEDDQDAGWDFIIENGERDRGQLRQLRWIHKHINKDGCPIRGWSEKLVQRALDSLAKDGCLAKLTTMYDLTLQDYQPTFLTNIYEDALGYLLDHDLWLMGEPGVGKTLLARSTAMMLSRFRFL